MNPLQILDALYESVMEVGTLYAEIHKDENMSDEVRMNAIDKVAKCANLSARIIMKKNAISQPESSKFEKGGVVSLEGGEFIIKKS